MDLCAHRDYPMGHLSRLRHSRPLLLQITEAELRLHVYADCCSHSMRFPSHPRRSRLYPHWRLETSGQQPMRLMAGRCGLDGPKDMCWPRNVHDGLLYCGRYTSAGRCHCLSKLDKTRSCGPKAKFQLR